MSLLLQESADALHVLLVQWAKAKATPAKGRVIRLDTDDCIICPVNFACSVSSFVDFDVIMPCVGEGVRRVRKGSRPKLPAHPLRLMKMYSHAIALHSMSEDQVCFDEPSAEHLTCAMCGCTNGSVRCCAFCLVPSHAECFQQTFGSELLGQRVIKTDFLPNTFAVNMIPNMFLAAEAATPSSSTHLSNSAWKSFLAANSEHHTCD